MKKFKLKGKKYGARKKHNKKAYRAKKHSRIRHMKGQQQALIYHPLSNGDTFPQEMYTTMTYVYRTQMPAGNLPTNQIVYWAMKGNYPYQPFNEGGNATLGTPYIYTAATGGTQTVSSTFSSTGNPGSYTTLATIYDYCQVISVDVQVTVNQVGGDAYKLYCFPYIGVQNSVATTPPTGESFMDSIRHMKKIEGSGNQGPVTLHANFYAPDVLGYESLHEFLGDKVGTSHCIANINLLPYNGMKIMFAAVSASGAVSTGITTFDYLIKYRVRWSGQTTIT